MVRPASISSTASSRASLRAVPGASTTAGSSSARRNGSPAQSCARAAVSVRPFAASGASVGCSVVSCIDAALSSAAILVMRSEPAFTPLASLAPAAYPISGALRNPWPGRQRRPSSLARDHAAPESTLALVKAASLACGRSRPLAWCSRPRKRATSPARPLGPAAGLRGPPQLEPVLAAAEQPGDVGPVEDEDRHRRPGGEGDYGPGGAEDHGKQRQRHRRDHRGHRGVAGQEEGADPNGGGRKRRERHQRQGDTAGRRDDLAAAAEADEQRPPVPDQRGDAGQKADELAAKPESERRRGKALGDVEQRHTESDLATERAPDVRRAGAATTDLADVDALENPRQPIAPGHAAEEVTRQDQENVRHSESQPPRFYEVVSSCGLGAGTRPCSTHQSIVRRSVSSIGVYCKPSSRAA